MLPSLVLCLQSAHDAGRLTKDIFFHSNPQPRVVAFVAGAGGGFVNELLTMPGASRAVVELRQPYSTKALADTLGEDLLEGACTRPVAEKLANAAFARAIALGEPKSNAVGLGCTAALISDRPHKGNHRCYICVRTEKGLHSLALTLAKGCRDRVGEDSLVSRCMLYALATACGLDIPAQSNGREFWRQPPSVDLAQLTDAQREALEAERLQVHTVRELEP